MKAILLVLGLMLCLECASQNDSTSYSISYQPTPGKELIKFTRTYYIGFGIGIVGTGISVLSAFYGSDEAIILGGALGVVGFGMIIYSFNFIGSAGRLMDMAMTSEGLSLRYHF